MKGREVPGKSPSCYPPEDGGYEGGDHRGSAVHRPVGYKTVNQEKHHESRYVGYGKRVNALEETVKTDVQDRDTAYETPYDGGSPDKYVCHKEQHSQNKHEKNLFHYLDNNQL